MNCVTNLGVKVSGRNSAVAKDKSVSQPPLELKAASSIHWCSNSCPIHEVRHPRVSSTRERNCSAPCCSAGCCKQYPTIYGIRKETPKNSISKMTYSVGANERL
jgi:hypothetical protein